MSIRIRVNVDDVDGKLEQYGAGAKLYWARDNTSSTGAFTDASGSLDLVTSLTAYDVDDTTGQPGHWYRTRVGNLAATDFSAWSPVFQAGELLAYATVTDLREELRLPASDHSRDNLLADLLRDASDWLTTECGRDFYRHPQVSGTETRLYDLRAGDTVIVDDIVSLTTVEYAYSTGTAYAILDAAGWTLAPRLASPYGVLELTDAGLLEHFYAGTGTVRLTGVFGFAAVPRAVRRATLDIARELYQQSVGGRPVGLEYGRVPPSAVTVIEKLSRHTYEHI
jgi:hypothetical protein